MSGEPGSKRSRRRWLHPKPQCFCWHCLPGKTKKRTKQDRDFRRHLDRILTEDREVLTRLAEND